MESFSLQLCCRRLNEGTEKRRGQREIGTEEARKKGERKKSVFHPHDTTTRWLARFSSRCNARFVRLESRERQKGEGAEGWRREGGASPTRVLFRIRAEQAIAPLLLGCILSPSQQASSPSLFLSSPLLDESARHLITQHYPPSFATPSFPLSLFSTRHPSARRRSPPVPAHPSHPAASVGSPCIPATQH